MVLSGSKVTRGKINPGMTTMIEWCQRSQHWLTSQNSVCRLLTAFCIWRRH